LDIFTEFFNNFLQGDPINMSQLSPLGTRSNSDFYFEPDSQMLNRDIFIALTAHHPVEEVATE
jgi:hypothetical protein